MNRARDSILHSLLLGYRRTLPEPQAVTPLQAIFYLHINLADKRLYWAREAGRNRVASV